MTTATKVKTFRVITPDGTLKVNFHPGQTRAWLSKKRYVAVLAGSQGGKTSFGPHWLDREIRNCGPGDYLIGTSTFPLLDRKLLPEFLYVFGDLFHYGTYNDNKKVFTFHTKKTATKKKDYVLFPDAEMDTKVFIGSAQNPESMESATVKAIWLDEPGQKQFKRETWEAVQRRGLINKARILFTTTLYGLGWLKTDIYDEGIKGDPDIDIIQFDSIENPAFPLEEYQRMQRIMPDWKFQMFHRGRYSQPAGLIYDSFDSVNDVVEPFEIPAHWPRYVGHDFGTANTAAVFYAQNPGSGDYFLFQTYKPGPGRSTSQHIEQWKEITKGKQVIRRAGGSHQEDEIRQGYTAQDWPIQEPYVTNVQEGILRVYALHKANRIYVFDDLYDYLDEKMSYSWKLDDGYHPTDEIEDKAKFHLMDAERGILGSFPRESSGDNKPISKRTNVF